MGRHHRNHIHQIMMAHLAQQQAAAAAAAAESVRANAERARADALQAELQARREADRIAAAAAAAMPSIPVSSLVAIRTALAQWRPGRSAGRKLRILRALLAILGVRGCGKSSFINAVMSGLLGRAISPAQVAPGEHHVTRELYSFDPLDYVRLFDLWGWTEGYTTDALLLAAGRLPEGIRYDDVPSFNDDRLVQNPTFANNEMHAMVIALPYGQHNEAMFGPMLQRMRETIRELTRTRVPVFVLLTKCDMATGTNGVAPDLSNFYSSALLDEVVRALATTLGLEKDHVIPVSAPVGNERVALSDEVRERSWSICLKALETILTDVNTFYDCVANGQIKRSNAPRFPIDTTPDRQATNGFLWLEDGQDATPTAYRVIDMDDAESSCRIQLTLDGVEYECIARASATLIASLEDVLFDVRNRDRVRCIANGCIALANPVEMVRVQR